VTFVIPHEGRNVRARILLRREFFERDAGLELGLFTNSTADLNETLATLGEPTGNGYQRIVLDDASWSTALADVFSQPKQTFTAGNGGWTGIIQGYFIATRAAGGTPRILGYEFDAQQLLGVGAIQRLGQVVSINTPAPHGLATGRLINVQGAVQAEYNGVFVVTVTGPNSFTYTVPGSPVSPATGAILVNRCFQMDVGSTYDVTPVLTFSS
jgi:hypothetical protein